MRDFPIDAAVITEGQPLVIERRQLPDLLPRMTPSTCYAARLFMELKTGN